MSQFAARSLVFLGLSFFLMQADADPPESEPSADNPVLRTAFKLEPLDNLNAEQLSHPIVEPLKLAHEILGRIEDEISDYTCTFVKRERIRGKLQDHEYIFAKVRHRQVRDGKVVPFSLYMRYDGPKKIKGREAIYVEEQNNNRMIARNGGSGNLKNVTLWVDPAGSRAMRTSNWPVTEFGIRTLTQRMIQGGRDALNLDAERRECEVRNFEGAKIDGRKAKCIQVRFPKRREELDGLHIARVFVDEESSLPVRFAHYTWPDKEGGTPRLMAEYNYLRVKPNVGLTDRDFDHRNPEYNFQLREAAEASDRSAGK